MTTEHAPHCNISERLSDICSCGADGTSTFETLYSQAHVDRLSAQLASVNKMNDKLLDLNRGLTVEVETLRARVADLEGALRKTHDALERTLEELNDCEAREATKARATAKAALGEESSVQ